MDATADEKLQGNISQTHSLKPVNHWAMKRGIRLTLGRADWAMLRLAYLEEGCRQSREPNTS